MDQSYFLNFNIKMLINLKNLMDQFTHSLHQKQVRRFLFREHETETMCRTRFSLLERLTTFIPYFFFFHYLHFIKLVFVLFSIFNTKVTNNRKNII